MSRFLIFLLALVLLALVPIAGCSNQPCAAGNCASLAPARVFAASSLKVAFDKMTEGPPVIFNYAGSQTLTAQLEQGAQADVFASADADNMKKVAATGRVRGTPQVFAHNRLEIAVEKGNPKGIHSLADLARSGVVVVLADPSVPVGKYTQQALAKAGVTVHPASLELQVTAVLSKVVLGEADAGIVYVSDVVTSGKVDGIPIPNSQNVVADYEIALLSGGSDMDAGSLFIRFVVSSNGQAILVAAGFEKA